MLPVATAPNAIVFGSGKVRIKDMARAGLVLNLIGAVVITAVCLIAFD
jgi:sodium-dependent dicarboxylate transporter 2/3/5